uniref:BHLH domain-containing protein n=1 Tax=Angiostrongylus cantonensis TaxID=6313 RepID=A0A0K0DLI5_ANGCA
MVILASFSFAVTATCILSDPHGQTWGLYPGELEMTQVNQGFNQLRLRVPRPHGSKHKLSKVETLREAARYIEQLHALLQQSNYTSPSQQQQRMLVQQQSYYSSTSTDVSPYYPSQVKSDFSPASSYYSDSSFEEQKYSQFMR